MQKFVEFDTISVGGLGAGASSVVLEQAIPEEVLVKRCVVNVVNLEGNVPFEVSIIETDQNGSASNSDRLSITRLVRTAMASNQESVNLDFTLTMRKFAGTSIAVIISNHGATGAGFQTKATYHYLEV